MSTTFLDSLIEAAENCKKAYWPTAQEMDSDGAPVEYALFISMLKPSIIQALATSLKEAHQIIHDEFCGEGHHPFCARITATLEECET